jgi:hypothetical protein
MAIRELLTRFRTHQIIILFITLIIVMVLLAWWVADRLIQHLDQQTPVF